MKKILLIIMITITTGCIGAGMSDYVININANYYIARSNSKEIIFYNKENKIIVNKNIKRVKLNDNYIIFEREFDSNNIEYIIFNLNTGEKKLFSNEEDLNNEITTLKITDLSKWINTNQEIYRYFQDN